MKRMASVVVTGAAAAAAETAALRTLIGSRVQVGDSADKSKSFELLGPR